MLMEIFVSHYGPFHIINYKRDPGGGTKTNMNSKYFDEKNKMLRFFFLKNHECLMIFDPAVFK